MADSKKVITANHRADVALIKSFYREKMMKDIGKYVALIVIFGVSGLILFTKNVGAVEIIGLFASGAVVGISVERIVAALRAKQKPQ